MNILGYLKTVTLFRGRSRYYRDIRILERFGARMLTINGVRQTSTYHQRLFRRALERFGITPVFCSVGTMLLLGTGGGFCIRLFESLYPKIRITAVDIDSVILALAKRFFGLADSRRLRLVRMDAKRYVFQAMTSRNRYDAVIVDIFSGNDNPRFIGSYRFVTALRSLLRKRGFVFINHANEPKDLRQVHRIMTHLNQVFAYVRILRLDRNIFFYASTLGPP